MEIDYNKLRRFALLLTGGFIFGLLLNIIITGL